MLVALTLLALLMLGATRAFNGPSPAVQARSLASKFIEQAGIARQNAVRGGHAVSITPQGGITDCQGAQPAPVKFFADGSMLAPPLCVEIAGMVLPLKTDALTGRIVFE